MRISSSPSVSAGLLLLLTVPTWPLTAFGASSSVVSDAGDASNTSDTSCSTTPILSTATATATSTSIATTEAVSVTTPATSSSAAVASSVSNGTCEFRTINYITHRLPQQCLGTPRSARKPSENATAAAEASEAQVTDGAGANQPAAGESAASSSEHVETGETTQSSATAKTKESATSSANGEQATELDAESELNDASFMSFEEWKKQMIEKGDPPKGNGPRRSSTQPEDERDPSGPYQAMESPSEAIKLNFEAGAAQPDGTGASTAASDGNAPTDPPRTEASGTKQPTSRSRDAGKTFKERFNYASFDAGATVVKTNRQAKNAKALLVENKDSYMLTPCSADNQHVVVELSDEVFIDTVVLANYEFFSSVFRQFSVFASDRYPPKGDRWVHLGTYEARNTREIQAFLVEEPIIWARYIKIEFLNHYGHEFYCPVSILRVHGKSQLEDYRQQEEAASGVDVEDEQVVRSTAPSEALQEQPVAENKSAVEGGSKHGTQLNDSEILGEMVSPWLRREFDQLALADPSTFLESCPTLVETPTSSSMNESVEGPVHPPRPTTLISFSSGSAETQNASNTTTPSTVTTTAASTPSAQSSNSTTTESAKPASPKGSENTAPPTKSSASPSASPSPPSQESFFKTVSRRLQLLESNSTLSLKYIEDQSRILRDAFAKVEKKQLAKTNAFLENLNQTVLEELRVFRQQYDQIWQSTILELESQRDRSEREVLAVSTRLNVLADEVVFQKRMAIVQSVLLLLCLGLVIFSRGTGGYIDLSIVQNMRSKSLARRTWNDDGDFSSPDDGRRPKAGWPDHGHVRYRSDESLDTARLHPDDSPQPPYTPASGSDDDLGEEPLRDQGERVRIRVTDESGPAYSRKLKPDTWQAGNTIIEEPSSPSSPVTQPLLQRYKPLRTQSSPATVPTTGGGDAQPDAGDDGYYYEQPGYSLQPLPSPPPEDVVLPQAQDVDGLTSHARKPLPALPHGDST